MNHCIQLYHFAWHYAVLDRNLGPQLTFLATTIPQLSTVNGEEKIMSSYESVKQPIIICHI